ncbi:MAG: Flp pilus assembly protein CpaB [Hyphomicrobiales bacterium]|nr:MAG: Flp pilus assembly protein CpaB [Hyphomicrobiales bacterium]
MKSKRLILIAVAIVAGLLAAMLLVNAIGQKPEKQTVITKVEEIPSDEVLVASVDVPIGKMITPNELQWQKWPQSGLGGAYIVRSSRPQALEELTGTIARTPFLSGEPIKEQKLIRSDRGFMSAILPKGRRAIAVQVSALNTAGGFVLPNDRVDVILTRQRSNGGERQEWYSETILENVRVLAIDQTIEDREGEKAVVGRETATLELGPSEAEIIAQSQQLGSISLALRSIADSQPGTEETVKRKRRSGVSYVKYGIQTQSTTSR